MDRIEQMRRWETAKEHRQAAALDISSATTELITHVLSDYPQAVIVPRSSPLADEDISLEIQLPLPMKEIYEVRRRIHEIVIQLQERYDVLILASAVPTSDSIGG
jgi:hypothetical protein